ncbi:MULTISPECIES: lipocalin-like domain-containing protein [Agrobacterium]|uniref:Iron ABC transporter permease n=1 Tax=Agrobacterium rosae TaxID=1972867 RepID=A0A1R3TCQ4_9HYPH|nr:MULTISPECIES: lipocalin-like domain-containing protein [Agrobacterium]KAA3515439.1 iron ABC transporter permease [Agrobacterium rosae]KAA3524405.1 iron ABC transporter permease [Agrobacterium rosae]MBN7804299.1 iron ABC transporter permease [Agrobacterium rosae]MCM2431308.1 iron ABC transporter permease [Agrobacterium rosae]MDX8302270.1 lipocalin-like domain-containing protein [Agrobacterium rosae]
MNARCFAVLISLLILICLPAGVQAQGFAGLGSDAQGFRVPERGVPLTFPGDHGPHPDFRIEWWYVTANLQREDGTHLGAQWTLFRSALAPGDEEGFSSRQIWLGHAAVTAVDRHYVAERLGRGGVGQAGVVASPFEAWIDDWQMKSSSSYEEDQLSRLELHAEGQDFGYQLTLSANGPMVLQGDRGYSIKSQAGQASYYYSQPFYQVTGTVTIGGAPVKVSGKAWLDREWSSQPLAANQTGWDWFSLHLASGEKVMAFRLRDSGGGYTSANWISKEGETTPLSSDDVVLEPVRRAKVNGKDIPVAWRVQIPSKGLDITTTALNDQAWMATSTPYWEGPISFDGTTSGVGYLEMTGY